MIADVKEILTRSPNALVQDALGVAAIGVIFCGTLYLPQLI
ncbi:MAG: hypothetical protein AAF700_06475 [Pseudomonadota bacterium]